MAAEAERKRAAGTAEMLNWEQRIITELEAGKKWQENWSALYSNALSMEDRIRELEAKTKNATGGSRLMTNSQLSYTGAKGFRDQRAPMANKRMVRDEEIQERAALLMNRQHCPAK